MDNWNEAKELIGPPSHDKIRQRLELVDLVRMGSANARLLERVGIDSRQKIGQQEVDLLFPELVRANQTSRLRNKPLLKRRVAARINAAKRQICFLLIIPNR